MLVVDPLTDIDFLASPLRSFANHPTPEEERAKAAGFPPLLPVLLLLKWPSGHFGGKSILVRNYPTSFFLRGACGAEEEKNRRGGMKIRND
jgi:hypothetical protein